MLGHKSKLPDSDNKSWVFQCGVDMTPGKSPCGGTWEIEQKIPGNDWKMCQENILMEFFPLYLPANRITNKYMYLHCWVLKPCQFLCPMIDRSPTVHHLLLKGHVLQADIVSLYNFQYYGHYTSHITFVKDLEALEITSGFIVFLAFHHVSDIFIVYWNISHLHTKHLEAEQYWYQKQNMMWIGLITHAHFAKRFDFRK